MLFSADLIPSAPGDVSDADHYVSDPDIALIPLHRIGNTADSAAPVATEQPRDDIVASVQSTPTIDTSVLLSEHAADSRNTQPDSRTPEADTSVTENTQPQTENGDSTPYGYEVDHAVNLVFLDSSLEQPQTLIENIKRSYADDCEWIVIDIDASSDGIQEISQALTGVTDVEAIHVISSSTDATIQIGSAQIDHDNIDLYREQLTHWSSALSERGDQSTRLHFHRADLSTSESTSDLLDRLAENTPLASSNYPPPRTELVFIDANTPDADQLLQSIQSQSDDNVTLKTISITEHESGIDVITSTLQQYNDLAAIHIISHGSQGTVNLGAQAIDYEQLVQYDSDIASWQNALSNNADILIYGCDVGAGEYGQQFITALAITTGADVTASDNTTGHNDLAGDWELEVSTGAIETAPIVAEDWDHTLLTYTVTNTNDTGGGSLRQAILNANSTAATLDTINFTIPGTGPHTIALSSALPQITDTLFIDGWSEPDYANDGVPVIAIDGSSVVGTVDGINLGPDSDGSELRGLSITGFSGDTIETSTLYNWIYGNYIGIGLDGVTADGGATGIHISNAAYGNRIGTNGDSTNDAHERNIIGGNTDGISLTDDPIGNGNVITGNYITGNYIGLAANGVTDVGNSNAGIKQVNGPDYNQIGGATSDLGNVISGNGGAGIELTGDSSDANSIQNNLIGTSANATTLIGNDGDGILLNNGPDLTQILNNTIVGSGDNGIEIHGASNNNVIQGNTIGTDATGTLNLGSGKQGIHLGSGTSNTTIGGTASGQGNVVAYSGQNGTSSNAGILITNGNSTASIRGNSIYNNEGQGIDLSTGTSEDGINFNDSTDTDTGGNNLQNWAVLRTAAINDAGVFSYNIDTTTLVTGTYDIDFYATPNRDGEAVEGARFLGEVTGVPGGNNSLAGTLSGVTLNPGEYITLITTDAGGNSSEFSNYAVATDSDSGGTVPQILTATTTTHGGLSLNEDGGNNSYLIANNGDAILGGRSQLTMEWQFTSEDLDETVFLSYATPINDNALTVTINPGGGLSILINGNGVTSTATDYRSIKDGSYHSLAITWDNTNGEWQIYIDGNLTDSGTGLTTGSSLFGSGTLIVGQEQDNVESGFDPGPVLSATLFDLRIFDDIRTPAEIAASHQTTLPHDEANLIANWQFNNLSDQNTVIDTVAGNNLVQKHTSGTGFYNSTPELTFSIDETAHNGTVVGQIAGRDIERNALIATLLAENASLNYNPETGKFYEYIDTAKTWENANTDANNSTLNGIAGRLVQINSASENQHIVDILNQYAQAQAYIGAQDSAKEGTWRWGDASNGEHFWRGDSDGYNINNVYTNWSTSNPNNASGQDFAKIFSATGAWDDVDGTAIQQSIIEYDADAVLDNSGVSGQQPLLYSIIGQTIGGAFSVDTSSGKISVANTSLLNATAQPVHSVVFRVTDIDGNTYDQAFSIALNQVVVTNNAPNHLSSGIELNNDGGNDTYLVADDGGAILGGLATVTLEMSFVLADQDKQVLVSYAQASDNDFHIAIFANGTAELSINSMHTILSGFDYSTLMDENRHSFAVSWDSSTGSWVVYVDGNYAESGAGLVTGQTINGTSGSGDLIFGQEQDASLSSFESTETFRGTLYDIRLWNTLRTETEVALHQYQKFDGANLPDGLIANWQMDEFTGAGNDEITDIVAANNLSIDHVTEPGFSTSTPSEGLNIIENATAGTRVGVVVASDPDNVNDIVSDGRFVEADNPGTATNYSTGQSFGGWTVRADDVDLHGTATQTSPTGGWTVDLNDSPGAIYQTLFTETGRQYQVVFEHSSNFNLGESVSDVRVSAGGHSQDFITTRPPGWSPTNMLFSPQSFSFTAESSSTDLDFASLDSNSSSGPVIGDIAVYEIPHAVTTILNNDASLSYDAATEKFYKFIGTEVDFHTAQAAAIASLLAGTPGQLVTIHSAYENTLVHNLAITHTANHTWLGASDSSIEGEFRWYDGDQESTLFSISSTAQPGSYVNWQAAEPSNGSGAEHHLLMKAEDGGWDDAPGSNIYSYIIEWDANEVLSGYTFALTDNAGGRFAIDTSSGTVSVADGTLLDYESGTTHNITVQVQDSAQNSYSEALSVSVSDTIELSQSIPGSQITEINEPIEFSTANGNAIVIEDNLLAGDTPVQVDLGNELTGTFHLAQTTGIAIVAGTNGGNFITIQGTVSAINAALDGLTYTPDNGYSGTPSIEVKTSTDVDLVGKYEFEGNYNDTSTGPVQHGTAKGDATLTPPDATRQNVLKLDGSGDYVAIASTFSELANTTLAAWVKLSSSAVTAGEVISIDNSVILRVNGSNDGLVGLFHDGSVYQKIGTGTQTNLADDQWHHVAFVFDDVNNRQSLYLDGQLVASENNAAAINYLAVNSRTTIGAHSDPVQRGLDLNGLIDSVRIYDRALSGGEITAIATDQSEISDTIALAVTEINDAPTFEQPGLITNGGFDTDISGWTTTGTVTHAFSSLRFGINDNVSPYTASQTIATQAGSTYQLIFDYRDQVTDRNQSLQVTVDGASNLLTPPQILNDVDENSPKQYNYTFTADSNSTTITFTHTSDTAGVANGIESNDGYLDNISVRYVSGVMGNVSFIEDGTATTLDDNIAVNDEELSTIDDFGGATVTIVRHGGANTEDAFSASGNLVFSVGTLELSGTDIGTYTSTNGTLTITFGAGTSNAQVNETLQLIQYRNTSDGPPDSVLLDWTFNDNNTANTQGIGGALEDTGSIRVSNTPVNNDPVTDAHYTTWIGSTEFVVNTTTANDQSHVRLAALSNGGLVAAWQSSLQDSSNNGIYFQLFDETGKKTGIEVRANITTANDQEMPEVAVLSDGNIVVAWTSHLQDSSGNGTYFRIFQPDGTAVTAELQANTHTSLNQQDVTLAALTAGGFIVGWESNAQDGDGSGLYFQRFDNTGSSLGVETQLNSITAGEQANVSITPDNTGGFSAVWHGASTGSNEIYGRQYDAVGVPAGPEVALNTTSLHSQNNAQVATLTNGSYVVVWESQDQDGDDNGLYGRLFNSAGSATTTEFQINTESGDAQQSAHITALSEGGFLVAWESGGSQDGDSFGVFAQQFDNNSNKVNGEFLLNVTSGSDQYNPGIALLKDGRFAAAWTSTGQDGDAGGIIGRLFTPALNENAAVGTVASVASQIVDPDSGDIYSYALADNAGGAFDIDSVTGTITVADTSLLDFENDASLDVTVRITDPVAGTYDEIVTIPLHNLAEAEHTRPVFVTVNEDAVLTFAGPASLSVTDTLAVTNTPMQVSLSITDGVLELASLTGITIVEGANNSSQLVINGTESDLNSALMGMTFTPTANFNGSVSLNMATALAADLRANYTFSGGNANDQSVGTTYNGTFQGNAATTNNGARGEVLSLDGNGDYVQINGLLGQPSDITLSAWINTANTDTLGANVISLGTSPALYLQPDGTLTGEYESGGTVTAITSAQSLLGSGWQHIAVTIDSTRQEMSLFVDGTLAGSTAASLPIEYDNSPNTIIGRAGDTLPGFDFNGLIDDVRVYSRALTIAEIDALATDRSQVTTTIAVDVTPVNDPPVVTRNTGVTSTIGGTVAISNSALNEGDPDDDGIGLTYTVTNPNNGQVELTTNAGIAATSFTQQDVNTGRVVFVHDGLSGANGRFDYTLADGAEDGAAPENGSFTITISGARSDSYSTDELTDLNINSAAGLLANDGQSGGQPGGNTVVGFDATTDSDENTVWVSNIGSVNLTIPGATYTTSPDNPLPAINAAFDFTGSSAGATTAALTSFSEIDGTQNATLEAWIYIDSLTGTNMIFDTGDVGNSGISVLTSGTNLIFAAAESGIMTTNIVSAPSAGNWHHLAISIKMAGAQELVLYIDGAETSILNMPVTLVNWAPGPFGLGTTHGTTVGGYSGDLNGQVAHFRIHDEALNPATVSYHAANPGLGSAQPFVASTDLAALQGTANITTDGSFQYSPDGQFESLKPGQFASDTFDYTYDDGLGNQQTVSASITVNGVNNAPILSAIEAGAAYYTENSAGISVTDNLSLSDIDHTDISAATITISSGFANAQDNLNFADQNGITGNYNPGTGVLLLSGSASVADYQSAIRSITYSNSSDNPSTATRTVSFAVNDGHTSSNTQYRDINFSAENDAPVLSSIEAVSTSYTENSTPVLITDTLALNDPDDSEIESAEVAITTNFVAGGEDVLGFINQSGITGTYSNTTGVLTLTGSATLTEYQAALRSITYQNTSQDPSNATRTISILVSDGDADSTAVNRDIQVLPQNDPPALTSIESAPAIYTENSAAISVTGNLSVADPDDTNIESAMIVITGNFSSGQDVLQFTNQNGISGTFNSGNGELSLSGTSTTADYQAAIRSITYENTSENPSNPTRTVSFTVNDGDINSNTVARDIEIIAQNDAPLLTVTGPVSYIENSAPVRLAPTATASDIDSADFDGGVLTISLTSGADALDRLSILSTGSSTGQVGAGTSTVHYEGILIGTHTGGEGSNPLTITFNTSATPQAVQAVLRQVAFEHLSENPQVARSFVITLNDGDEGSDSDSESISITPVNDSPALNSLGGESVFALNDGSTITLDQGIVANTSDPDTATDFNGGSLNVSGAGFTSGDILGMDTSASITLSTGLSNGSVVRVSGVDIGTLHGVTASNVNVNLTSNATLGRVQALLQAYTFESSSSTLGQRSVAYELIDGDGIANGGTDTGTAVVNVFVGQAGGGFITTDEDTTYTLDVNDFIFTGSPAAAIQTITITSLPDNGVLQLSGATVNAGDVITRSQLDNSLLTYQPPTNQNGVPYTVFDFYINNGNSTLTVLPGEPNSLTFSGGSWTAADQIIANTNNFGPTGTVPTSISVAAQSTNTNAAYLSQGNLLIDGFVVTDSTTADEFTAIDTWVRGGGILVATSDHTNFEPVTSRYGLVTINNGSTRWTVENSTHPIMNGTFGLVGNIGATFSTAGAIAQFDPASLSPGDLILARDSFSDNPTMVLRSVGSGFVLMTSDEGIFRASMGTGGNITTVNDRLVANIVAWAIDLQQPTDFFTTNVNVSPVNDPAALSSIESTTLVYIENDGQLVTTNTIETSDIDDTNIESASIAVSNNFTIGEDVLDFTEQLGITGNYNLSTGILSLTGSATLAEYQSAIRSVTYENTSDIPSTQTRTLSYLINDGDDTSNVLTRHISITAENDAPVLSTIEGASANYIENSAGIQVTGNLAVADPDDTLLNSASVTISNNFVPGEDIIGFTNQLGITGSYNQSTGILTLTGTSSIANYQAALRSLTYSNTSDTPSELTRTISFSVNDSQADSPAISRNITVVAQNDLPLLSSLESHTAAYTENDPAVFITNTIELTDLEQTHLDSASISISANFVSDEDKLNFVNQSGITGMYDFSTGILSLSGPATLADYQTALRSITYENTSDDPSGLTRTISFTANDGVGNGNTLNRDISISVVNDPPVLATIEGMPSSYIENDPAVIVTANLTVADIDDTHIEFATVYISNNFATGEDILNFTNQNGITGSYDATNGILSLSGSATNANYQQALRSITYENTSDDPSVLTRTVTFTTHDGDTAGNSLSRDILFTAVNDAPMLSTIEGLPAAYTEDDSAMIVTGNLSISDLDSTTIENATVFISANFATGQDVLEFTTQSGISGSFNALNGTLSLSGSATLADYQSALRSVTYKNTSDIPSELTRTVSFSVNDGTTDSNTISRQVEFTAVNDAPVISHFESLSMTYTENDTPSIITSTLQIADADDTLVESATISISNNFAIFEDVLKYSDQLGISGNYNASTGVLALSGSSSLANYQTALRTVAYENISDNPSQLTRTVSFSINDGDNSSNLLVRDIDIVAVDDAPVTDNIEVPPAMYTENTAPVYLTNTLTLTDVDNTLLSSATVAISSGFTAGQDVLGYTTQTGITGSYDSAIGVLTLVGSAPVSAYENAIRSITFHNTSEDPAEVARTLGFSVSDGTLSSIPVYRDIQFTAVNDAPVLATLEGTPVLYTENNAPVITTNTLTNTDVDDTTLESATIAISGNFASGEDLLHFTDHAGISGTFDSTAGILYLTGAAPLADYQAAIRSVTFENTSDDPSDQTRTLSYVVHDGEADSNTIIRSLSFTAVNDAPELSAIEAVPVRYIENDLPVTVTNALTLFDADDTLIESASIQISGNLQPSEDTLEFIDQAGISGTYNALGGTLSLTGSATVAEYQAALRSITYVNSSDNPSLLTRTLSFSISDGELTSNSVSRDIQLTAVNDAPQISAIESTQVLFTENDIPLVVTNTLVLGDFDDTDLESATVTIAGNFTTGEDLLLFSAQSGITGTFDAAIGTLTLTGSASVADYQNALRSVAYQNTSDDPSSLTRGISYQVSDGLLDSNIALRSIAFAAVNDAPVLSAIEAAPISYIENDAATRLTSSMLLNDVDDTLLKSATITIIGNYASGEDVLSFADQNGITGTYSAGVLNLTGTASVADYETAIQSVTYHNTSDKPSELTRTLFFVTNDGDFDSNILSRDIAFTAVNDSPVVTSTPPQTTGYIENDSPVILTGSFLITDFDDSSIESASVSITTNYAPGEDHLLFSDQSGISGNFDSATGTLSLNGSATVANYEAAIRSITYHNTSDDPSGLDRSVEFIVNDGEADSNTVSQLIAFTTVNDAPVLSALETTPINYTENDAPTLLSNTLALADIDDNLIESATVSISNNLVPLEDLLGFTDLPGITGNYEASTGTLQLTGSATKSAYETALRSVTYENTSDDPSALTRTVTIEISDGNLSSNLLHRDIRQTPVNDAPMIDTIETLPAAFIENGTPATISGSISVADVDDIHIESARVAIIGNFHAAEDTLDYSSVFGIAGNYNPISGILTLSGTATAAQYQTALQSVTYLNTSEHPSTENRTVEFAINDGELDSNRQIRDILIIPVNDAPQLLAMESTAVSFSENSVALGLTSGVVINDLDDSSVRSATVAITSGFSPGNDYLTYTNQSAVTGNFDPTTGVLTLTGSSSLSNYESVLRSVAYINTSDDPTADTRTVAFTVTDSQANSNTLSRQVIVVPSNDAPVAAHVEDSALNYQENSIALPVTDTLTLSDPDDVNLKSARVVIAGNFSAGEDTLEFTNQNGISGHYNALTGVLLLSGSASVADYETALGSVAYANGSDNPSALTRTIEYLVSDGDTLSNIATRDISFTAINDNPVLLSIESDSAIYTENQLPLAVTDSLTVADVDNLTLESAMISISSNYSDDQDTLGFTPFANITGAFDTSTGILSLSGTGTLTQYQQVIRSVTYHNSSDNPSTLPRTIEFAISDAASNSAIVSRVLAVQKVNDAPAGSDNQISFLEDTDYVLAPDDFGFSDLLDDHNFAGVVIRELPALGTMSLNGTAITAGQFISISEIAAGNLLFTPQPNATGSAYDNFRFRVADDGGTTLNGVDTAITTNQITFHVININDHPSGTDTTVSTQEDTTYIFALSDFGFSDSLDGDQLNAVKISSLPDSGVLALDGTPVTAGTVVDVAAIEAGLFRFTPPLNVNGLGYNGFSFQVQDDGGNANGGEFIDPIENHISFDVPGVNDPPRLISVGATVDEGSENVLTTDVLFATDADDLLPDELTFQITSLPINGNLTIAGSAATTNSTFTLTQLQQDQLRYLHDGSETSEDFFDIQVSDGGEDGSLPATGRFALVISEVIDPAPVINDEAVNLRFGEEFNSLNGSLLESGENTLAASSLRDNPLLFVSIENEPSSGSLQLNSDGSFSYAHNGSAALEDSFSYRVTNEDGIFAIATVAVRLEPPLGNAFEGKGAGEQVKDTEQPKKVEEKEVVEESEDENPESTTEDSQSDQQGFAPGTNIGDAFAAARAGFFKTSELTTLAIAQVQSAEQQTTVDAVLADLAVKQNNTVQYAELENTEFNISTVSLEILSEVKTVRPHDVVTNKQFVDGLKRLDQDLQDSEDSSSRRYSLQTDATLGVSLSATAGVLAWALRGGALFASAMASTPLWSSIDPVRVLATGKRDSQAQNEDNEVEQYFSEK